MAKDQFMDRFRRKQDKTNMNDRVTRQTDPDLLDEEDRLLSETPPVEPIQNSGAVGRNEPCPCGSGKKYKKCCALKS